MDFEDFKNMILKSPVKTSFYEYKNDNTIEACVLVDFQKNGLSAVYSFFNPEMINNSLGTYIILDLILMSKSLDLSWLYLGYYIEQSNKMSYKSKFKPFQIFKDGSWKFDQ